MSTKGLDNGFFDELFESKAFAGIMFGLGSIGSCIVLGCLEERERKEYVQMVSPLCKSVKGVYDKDNNGMYCSKEAIDLARALGVKEVLPTDHIEGFELRPASSPSACDYSCATFGLYGGNYRSRWHVPVSRLQKILKLEEKKE